MKLVFFIKLFLFFYCFFFNIALKISKLLITYKFELNKNYWLISKFILKLIMILYANILIFFYIQMKTKIYNNLILNYIFKIFVNNSFKWYKDHIKLLPLRIFFNHLMILESKFLKSLSIMKLMLWNQQEVKKTLYVVVRYSNIHCRFSVIHVPLIHIICFARNVL